MPFQGGLKMWRLHRFVDEVGDTAVEVSERETALMSAA